MNPSKKSGVEPRVALVTGSGRGMGRGVALRLAGDAVGVAVHYFRGRDAALETVRTLRRTGAAGVAFRADLTKEREAMDLVRRVERRFGRIDILVNNVGPILMKPWDAYSGREWTAIMAGNLLSAFYCLKAVLPGMRKRGWGRVINIGYSRVEQLAAFPTIAPYAAAKTGLLILTRTAAVTEQSRGVTVNMVSPGLIKGGNLPPNRNIPESGIGRFEDVAEAVAFLASDRAQRITGADIIVSGTWKM